MPEDRCDCPDAETHALRTLGRQLDALALETALAEARDIITAVSTELGVVLADRASIRSDLAHVTGIADGLRREIARAQEAVRLSDLARDRYAVQLADTKAERDDLARKLDATEAAYVDYADRAVARETRVGDALTRERDAYRNAYHRVRAALADLPTALERDLAGDSPEGGSWDATTIVAYATTWADEALQAAGRDLDAVNAPLPGSALGTPPRVPRIAWCPESGDPASPELIAYGVDLHLERTDDDAYYLNVWREARDGEPAENVMVTFAAQRATGSSSRTPRPRLAVNVDEHDDIDRAPRDGVSYMRTLETYRVKPEPSTDAPRA